jgi:hypothetical protein
MMTHLARVQSIAGHAEECDDILRGVGEHTVGYEELHALAHALGVAHDDGLLYVLHAAANKRQQQRW